MSLQEILEMHTDEEIDFIEEIRLRSWARTNYASVAERDQSWHPVVLEEMDRRDRELAN